MLWDRISDDQILRFKVRLDPLESGRLEWRMFGVCLVYSEIEASIIWASMYLYWALAVDGAPAIPTVDAMFLGPTS